MTCKYCGAELSEDSQVCSACGKPAEAEETPVEAAQEAPVESPAQQENETAELSEETEPAEETEPVEEAEPVEEVEPVEAAEKDSALEKKANLIWWILAGLGITLLIVAIVLLFVRTGGGKADPAAEVSIPPYVETPAQEDWNAEGVWSLNSDYLYGEWVSDPYEDGTVEALRFGDNGEVELWSGDPGGASDDLGTWNDGGWVKKLLYSGTYTTEENTLSLLFEGKEESVVYQVNMTGLFEMELFYEADGTTTHFEQASW